MYFYFFISIYLFIHSFIHAFIYFQHMYFLKGALHVLL